MGISGAALKCFQSYSSVSLSDLCTSPQVPFLGLSFSLLSASLRGHSKNKHGTLFHFYADDSQIHCPKNRIILNRSNTCQSVGRPSKPEVIVLGPSGALSAPLDPSSLSPFLQPTETSLKSEKCPISGTRRPTRLDQPRLAGLKLVHCFLRA